LGTFYSELGSRGYIEGKNLILDVREANGRLERIPALMDELIALRPDVIVAVSNQVVAAAQHATATIPIVMWSVLDPVRFGLVSSLARPGGNSTGTTIMSDASMGKAVELVHLLVPAAHRVAVLMGSGPGQPVLLELTKKAAEAMGLIVVPISAPAPADLDRAFEEMVAKKCDALFVLINPAHSGPAIPLRAAKLKLPALSAT
jgi:putative tryptophan/tyrosine transport system substrate-binding protein